MQEFAIDENDAGTRVDLVIARIAAATRSQVAAAIRAGTVLVNGHIIKGSYTTEFGDIVSFRLEPLTPLTAEAEALPLDIIYEDETLLIVNKAAGMVTHPAHGSPSGTLVNALLAHVAELPGDPLRPGIIHRLDRDTSGLLLVAKTPQALTTLGRAMQKRYIEREYVGLVVGTPQDDAGRLEGPLARDMHNRLRYAVRSEGKPAVTHFRVLERLRGITELSFKLETGRTHQIRVHMASYGNAILNDPLYGRRDKRLRLPGQVLHARQLKFKHPVTKEFLAFEAPIPPDYLHAKSLFV